MDKKTAISKIRKCLALSKSANEHEAAAALRQAQALAQKYSISEIDILAAEATEARAKASAKKKPASWENALARTISNAFGCDLVFLEDWDASSWAFIGNGINPEIATYAFTVLFRQLKKERATFITKECKRLKRSSRTRRADLFCSGWVASVSGTVQRMARTENDSAAIAAYKKRHIGELTTLDTNNRNADHKQNHRDHAAYAAEREAGKNARLHHGVNSSHNQQLALS
ncbi:Uncharacterized protein ChrSV_1516 [Chromobacterium vaccinii]|nr:Uncharacterized protein ChrSW_1516 [Chromobacterium vaccinii]QND88974.1 Uncharacterized protein ChrSV_1516 [Chromobacterium vaccinii]